MSSEKKPQPLLKRPPETVRCLRCDQKFLSPKPKNAPAGVIAVLNARDLRKQGEIKPILLKASGGVAKKLEALAKDKAYISAIGKYQEGIFVVTQINMGAASGTGNGKADAPAESASE
jgi:hypothetical protein